MPAGKVAFSSAAAPLPEPWERAEADLMAHRQQLANHAEEEDEPAAGGGGGGGQGGGGEALPDGAEPHGRPQKRVRHFLVYPPEA